MSDSISKFQNLLRELFQFDCADLDFGIYRIMNHKRDEIERFITVDLPGNVKNELNRGALAEQTRSANALEEVTERIEENFGKDAIDADGHLSETYHGTPLGVEYLALQVKVADVLTGNALEFAVFNHLYSFFSRYYQDGDFISKPRYSKRHRYAIPYNGEEVHLHWANRDQYYVKTGEHFRDYSFQVRDLTVHFKLKTADVEQDNVKGDKRFFLPLDEEPAWAENTRQLEIPIGFRPLTVQEEITYGNRNQQEAILAEAVTKIPGRLEQVPEALNALTAEKRRNADSKPVSVLEHHLKQYTRRNTSDFFIHKDLKGFLVNELDFFLKNEVLNLDEVHTGGEERAEGWFQTLRTIRSVGSQIIDFLNQIENFQRMLWEKRKFITETQYCISVGYIESDFYEDIAGCEAQWEQWNVLLNIGEDDPDLFTQATDNVGNRVVFLQNNPTLPLDTKHFDKDFTDRLIGSYEDLDSMTDGLLIHSENFQALSLIQARYQSKIQCIYIDPPYNTNASSIDYKNGYKASSWMSLLDDRLRISKPLLTIDGVLATAIDDEQQRELSFLLSGNFANRLLGTICVRANPSGRPTQTGYSVSHEYLLFAGKGDNSVIGRMPPTAEQSARFSQIDEEGPFEWRNLRREGAGSDRAARPTMYYPIYLRGTLLRVPNMEWDVQKREWCILEDPKADETIVWPNNEDGIEKRWRWEWQTVISNMRLLAVRPDRSGNPYVYVKRRPHEEGVVSVSSWFDAKYSATEHGTALLKSLFGQTPFSYPKSIHAVADAIYIGGARRRSAIVLDYFAGSGTTGHAVINLNREDGGERKFILAEMGNHFDTVLLPRIKKVMFTPEWKDGNPKRMATIKEAEGGPRIVKYIRLESYEDALNNIDFDETSGQSTIQFHDYLLKYMLQWETKHSSTLLNVEDLSQPFNYSLNIHVDGQTRQQTADIPETFNYLIGLCVETRRVYNKDDVRYVVYRGRIEHRRVVVIWRETKDWDKAALERDLEFVDDKKLTEGVDEIYVNGDSLIREAKALDPVFKRSMFQDVTA
ncbi:MAG: DNA methyltransferase [Gemmatimonadota bacterium]|nr:DNA methyltransferase [Gemmatimonadota bacterium]